MFFAMPFAYFFTEAEGFAGSRKVIILLLFILKPSVYYVDYRRETGLSISHRTLAFHFITTQYV